MDTNDATRIRPCRSATIVAVAVLCVALASCGGKQRPKESNYLEPIRLAGCDHLREGQPADLQTLAAMVVSLDAQRYTIYGVSLEEFKIYTDFANFRGIIVGWEVQVYSDGSAMLQLPETQPMQPIRSMEYVKKHAAKLVKRYNQLKCRDLDWLRRKADEKGYTI